MLESNKIVAETDAEDMALSDSKGRSYDAERILLDDDTREAEDGTSTLHSSGMAIAKVKAYGTARKRKAATIDSIEDDRNDDPDDDLDDDLENVDDGHTDDEADVVVQISR